MQFHWLNWLVHLDKTSVTLFGGTITLGAITHWTASGVSLFFTVAVGSTAIILNVVKTRIEILKERDRKKRLESGELVDEDYD